jgi:hypothetical protein
MPAAKLKAALEAVDWNALVADFLAAPGKPEIFATGNLRLAIWAKQLEEVDKGNPALIFVREMQLAGQNVTVLSSLGLYKAAAGPMRATFETALYYTYFRAHPVELATLARDPSYYVDKTGILEFQKMHVPGFTPKQEKLGLVSRINSWYKSISAIVHAQNPGAWSTATAVADIALDLETLGELATEFTVAVSLVDDLFKISLAPEVWSDFSHASKAALLKGVSAEHRVLLGLDKA